MFAWKLRKFWKEVIIARNESTTNKTVHLISFILFPLLTLLLDQNMVGGVSIAAFEPYDLKMRFFKKQYQFTNFRSCSFIS